MSAVSGLLVPNNFHIYPMNPGATQQIGQIVYPLNKNGLQINIPSTTTDFLTNLVPFAVTTTLTTFSSPNFLSTNNGDLKYIGTGPTIFQVIASLTLADGGENSDEFVVAFAINGVTKATSRLFPQFGLNTSCSIQDILTLNTNDVVTVVVGDSSAPGSVYISTMNVIVVSV